MTTIVLQIEEGGVPRLREVLEDWGYTLEDRPHAHFLARDPETTLTAYASGKLLVTGRAAERVARNLTERSDLPVHRDDDASDASGASTDTAPHRLGTSTFRTRVGTDEAGKGDYFGPLVVAGVHVATEDRETALLDLGVRESKRVEDTRVHALARAILNEVPATTVRLDPPRYNDIHDDTGNLNRILAWAHARCIEDLLEDHPATLLVVDRFARGDILQRALMDRGRTVDLVEEPRGERDVAVAAASIIARSRFLRGLNELSRTWDITLPKGAGDPVLEAGRRFLTQHDAQDLRQVAKVHFRTTQRLTG